MKCIICSKILSGKQTKFCSKDCKQKDINKRHQNYKNQGNRGFLIKKKLLEHKGNSCSKCDYNKNFSALCFHHLKDKSFSLDIRHCSNTSWEKLLNEVEKCIVLCHNCHMEEHYPNYMIGGPGVI